MVAGEEGFPRSYLSHALSRRHVHSLLIVDAIAYRSGTLVSRIEEP